MGEKEKKIRGSELSVKRNRNVMNNLCNHSKISPRSEMHLTTISLS